MKLITKSLNHVALHVLDVAVSIDFYQNVLLLESLPRPAFDFAGAWFRLGTLQELHLIGERDNPVFSGSRSNHFALEVDDLDAWAAHLATVGATFRPPKTRPDGNRQIFITDPDGHSVELVAFV